MTIELSQAVPAESLDSFRRAYLASLQAPFDGMWEAFAAGSPHHEIRCDGRSAGYFCLQADGHLLQLYLEPSFEARAADVFAEIVARDEVEGAVVSTGDPLFLGLCLDRHTALSVQTYLYRDHRQVPVPEAPNASFRVVDAGELEAIADLQRDSLDQDPGDWLTGYLSRLISRRELYALCRDGEVVATGELRVSDSQPPFADLGVITMRRHRRSGFASEVLSRLKELCAGRDLRPICSTTVDNLGAQRAIANAGFVSRHRLLQVSFR